MRHSKNTDDKNPIVFAGVCGKPVLASALTMATVLSATVPAWTAIDNEVTASGLSPSGTSVSATATESVDVEDDTPSLSLSKTVVDDATGLALGTDVPEGTVVRYVFTVVNNGNVTITDVGINEIAFDGATSPTIGNESSTNVSGNSTDATGNDGNWESLAPGDEVVFTGTYTVVNADIAGQGGGDGAFDNTATASGDAPASTGFGTVTSPGNGASFDLDDADAQLSVVKVATLLNGTALADPSAAEAAVGDVITYTYTVTNTGNVPITSISLVDTLTAGFGTPPSPSGESLLADNGTSGDSLDGGVNGSWDTLGPDDVITFTGTYTVTQGDVDNLQ
ncbi:MAG: hypothetical protein AAF404_07680 [Pseudomonadota bacterium]